MGLSPFFSKYKILIFAGNGGTGKTTMSSTWGECAAREGKRVALLTIDPSRRLGSVYDMDLQNESFKTKKIGNGQLDIYLIHSQQVIAEFITSEWGAQEAEKLLQNKIFKQVATTLSENQSLSTIYKLSKILKDNYDLVVVDTPPAHHTVDFFRSPASVIRLFRDNVFAKLMSEHKTKSKWSPQSFFLRIFTYLVGADFIEQMDGFFNVLVRFQTQIVLAAEEIQKLLSSSQACYFMVTLPEPFKVKELTHALDGLKEQGIFAKHIIANRAYPVGLNMDQPPIASVDSKSDFNVYYHQQWEYYRQKMDAFHLAIKKYNDNYQIYLLPERTFASSNIDLGKLGEDLANVFKKSEIDNV